MKETGLTGKRRSTTIAATPDDGKSQRKIRRRSLAIQLTQHFYHRSDTLSQHAHSAHSIDASQHANSTHSIDVSQHAHSTHSIDVSQLAVCTFPNALLPVLPVTGHTVTNHHLYFRDDVTR